MGCHIFTMDQNIIQVNNHGIIKYIKQYIVFIIHVKMFWMYLLETKYYDIKLVLSSLEVLNAVLWFLGGYDGN